MSVLLNTFTACHSIGMQIIQVGLTNYHPALYQWPIRFKDLASKNRLECRHLQGWPRTCRHSHTGSYVTHQLDSSLARTCDTHLNTVYLPTRHVANTAIHDNTALIGSGSTADMDEFNSTAINSHISASTANTAEHDITAWPAKSPHRTMVFSITLVRTGVRKIGLKFE